MFESGKQLLVEGILRIIGSAERFVNLTTNTTPPTAGDWSGVKFVSGSSGYINHSNITYSAIAVNLINTDNIQITNCTFYETQVGIKLEDTSDYNYIENNSIFLCGTGIQIYNSDHNTLYDNEIHNTSVTGLSMGVDSNNNNIDSNRLHNGLGRGISLSGNANNNTFLSNKIYSQQGNGIQCTGAPGNIFSYNLIYSNSGRGIILYSGTHRNLLTYNTIYQNTHTGLSVDGISNCQIELNDILENGNGVSSVNSMDIKLENNTISASTNSDILLSQQSIVSSVNNTFDQTKVIVYDSSLFFVYWYMFLETRDKTDSITPAMVNITNSTPAVIVPDMSINGKLDWILCLGYIHKTWGQDTSMNPYWVKADNGSKSLKMGFDMSEKSRICVVKFTYYPAPESTLPSYFQFSEDTTFEMNLSKYFTSPESLEYRVEPINGGNLTYGSLDPKTTILSAAPPKNWNGKEKVRITASANLGGEIIRDTTLKVQAVNDPPVITELIPNYKKSESATAWEINLSGYAEDYDLVYGDSLSWFVTDVNESLLNITVKNASSVLHFSLQSGDPFGNDELKVWVNDKMGDSDYRVIWVNITAENDAPMLKEMTVFPATGSTITIFNFSVKYIDIDGDPPNYIIIKLDNRTSYQMYESDSSDKNVMDGKQYCYSTILDSASHYFWFECSDGNGGYNITPKQNGPIVTMANKGSLRGKVTDSATKQELENANITVIPLDNPTIQFNSTSDSTGNYTVLNLEPGKYKIYATAERYKDSNVYQRTIIRGGVVILDFELAQLPEDVKNTAITAVRIDVNRTNITQGQAIEFIGYAEDLDGDVLNFIWDFADGTVQLSGQQVSHTFFKNGTFNVMLAVKDTDGNIVTCFILINATPAQVSDALDGNGDSEGALPDSETKKGRLDPLIFLIILIIIIIIIILVFIYIYIRRHAEEEQRRLAAAEAELHEQQYRKSQARRRRKRERNFEFVDREKQNVEQVNLMIAKIHSDRASTRKTTAKPKSEYKQEQRQIQAPKEH